MVVGRLRCSGGRRRAEQSRAAASRGDTKVEVYNSVSKSFGVKLGDGEEKTQLFFFFGGG